jgi:hypothetical protein
MFYRFTYAKEEDILVYTCVNEIIVLGMEVPGTICVLAMVMVRVCHIIHHK